MEAVTPPSYIPALVRVHMGHRVETFIVRQQDSNNIIVVGATDQKQQLILENTNNGWRVQGDTTHQYQVEITPEVDITGQPIIDINILKYLDFELLEYLCLHVPYIQGICKQGQLWEAKTRLLYPTFPHVNGITNYRIYSRLHRERLAEVFKWATKRRI